MQMIFCAKMLDVISCNKWSNFSKFTVYCINQLAFKWTKMTSLHSLMTVILILKILNVSILKKTQFCVRELENIYFCILNLFLLLYLEICKKKNQIWV